MSYLRANPYMLRDEEGQRIHSWGAAVAVKATSEQTGGAFNLFDITCPPGYATSLHIHYAEDVAVYVLEGALTFFWGDEKMAAAAGAYFYQPRGIPHGYRVEGETPARFLYLTIPAGLDRFVVDKEQRTPNSGLVTAAARYHIESLGPLPD